MHTHKHSHHWVIFSMLQSLKNAVKNTVHNYQTQRSFTTTVLRPNNLILKNWIKTTCHRFGQNWSVIVMLNYQMLCFESSKQLNSAKKHQPSLSTITVIRHHLKCIMVADLPILFWKLCFRVEACHYCLHFTQIVVRGHLFWLAELKRTGLEYINLEHHSNQYAL